MYYGLWMHLLSIQDQSLDISWGYWLWIIWPGPWQWTAINSKAHHITPCVQVADDKWQLQSQHRVDRSNHELRVGQVQLVCLEWRCQLPEFVSMQIYGKTRPLWSLILSAVLCSASMKETLQLDQFNTNSGGRRVNKSLIYLWLLHIQWRHLYEVALN